MYVDDRHDQEQKNKIREMIGEHPEIAIKALHDLSEEMGAWFGSDGTMYYSHGALIIAP